MGNWKYILAIRDWIDTFRSSPRHLNIWMTAAESSLYYIWCNSANSLLEFGCGGSTHFALTTQVRTIYSVESDLSWINKLKKYRIIKNAISAGRLALFHANIGKVGFCGVPCDLNFKDFSSYHTQPFIEMGKEKCSSIDLVLVDGRFRVACALQAILHCRQDTTIIFHDYSMRPEYHCVEKYLEKIDSADSLVVFKIRNGIDMQDVMTLFADYSRNCD